MLINIKKPTDVNVGFVSYRTPFLEAVKNKVVL